MRPVTITQTISILSQNPTIGVVHGNAQNFGNKSTLWKGKPFDIAEMVLNNYIDTCTGFRKTTWEIFGGYDEN